MNSSGASTPHRDLTVHGGTKPRQMYMEPSEYRLAAVCWNHVQLATVQDLCSSCTCRFDFDEREWRAVSPDVSSCPDEVVARTRTCQRARGAQRTGAFGFSIIPSVPSSRSGHPARVRALPCSIRRSRSRAAGAPVARALLLRHRRRLQRLRQSRVRRDRVTERGPRQPCLSWRCGASRSIRLPRVVLSRRKSGCFANRILVPGRSLMRTGGISLRDRSVFWLLPCSFVGDVDVARPFDGWCPD